MAMPNTSAAAAVIRVTAAARTTPGQKFYIHGGRFHAIQRHGKGRRVVWYEGGHQVPAGAVAVAMAGIQHDLFS